MKPNILFIVIDSLRSDKFHSNDKTSLTPNIDSLIREEVLFKNTISSIPSTKHATASIMTSLYPFKTGGTDDNLYKLNSSSKTLIKAVIHEGYHAYATIPELFSHTDLFSEIENKDMLYNNFTSRLPIGLGKKIIEKLNPDNMKEPWIYYIHLLDLIRPVIAVGEFNKRKYGVDQYDRVLSSIDFWLGKILKKINLENTLLIITSDHGNYPSSIKINGKHLLLDPSLLYKIIWKIGLYLPTFFLPAWIKVINLYKIILLKQKTKQAKKLNLSKYQKRVFLNVIGHTRDIHDDYLVVPLLFAGFGVSNKQIISQSVSQLDIFPTIIDILDIKGIHEKIDGKSLLPLMEGEIVQELSVYVESMPTRDNNFTKTIGIRTSQYKFCKNTKNNKIELYDLRNDSLEENDISNQHPDVIKQMNKMLLEVRQYTQTHNKEKISNEERKKIEEELRKLGYL